MKAVALLSLLPPQLSVKEQTIRLVAEERTFPPAVGTTRSYHTKDEQPEPSMTLLKMGSLSGSEIFSLSTQYEPIWYGWRTGTKHHWCGDRDQGDVWQFPKPSASELHPTMKPVGLIERAIANSSPPGAIVLDLFAGSGTTIIAAERQGRTCYALELEPAYVQVALERWKLYTGRAPELEEG